MDANGGCGLVLSISQSVCQTPNQALHYCLYYIKLWLEKCMHLDSFKIKYIVYAGIPFLYMLVVVPLGFLVNIDDIGYHYGQYNATNGELLAYVYMHLKLHYLENY